MTPDWSSKIEGPRRNRGPSTDRPGAMTRLPLPFLGLAAAALLAACSTAAAPSPSPASASLDGHTYLSTGAQGVTLVPGTQISLAFDDGNLTAQAGCNSMGGTYAVDGDRITTTQMFMTEMGCDEPRMQQDEWLAQFLGEVTYTLKGDTLTLTNGPIQVTLLDKEVATPDLPLEGTRWILDGIVTGDAVSSVPVGVTASIRVSGGNVEVEAGCNQGGGTVEVAPGSLTFGPIAPDQDGLRGRADVGGIRGRGRPVWRRRVRDRCRQAHPDQGRRRADVPRGAVAREASIGTIIRQPVGTPRLTRTAATTWWNWCHRTWPHWPSAGAAPTTRPSRGHRASSARRSGSARGTTKRPDTARSSAMPRGSSTPAPSPGNPP